MLNFNKKQLILIGLTLVLGLGLFGCGKKSTTNTNQNINVNQDQNTNLNTNTATTTGEIDISDWQTYRNEEYGFEFRYPENLIMKQNSIPLKLINFGENNPEILSGRYELKSTDEDVFLTIEINPDGYGPFFPDKSYGLINNGNYFFIASICDNYYPVRNQIIPVNLQMKRLVIASYHSPFLSPKTIPQSSFSFKYYHDVNSEFNEQTLKDIILSFKFYNGIE